MNDDVKQLDRHLTISVVIAAYNAAKWIKSTLESVLNQTFPVYEIIVIDDGSTDDTAKIVQFFPQVHYVYQKNQGVQVARNHGIAVAKGEYIAFIDHDDLWHSSKLEKQMQVIQSKNVAWVSCRMVPFSENKDFKNIYSVYPMHEGEVLEQLFLNNFIGASTPVIHRDILNEIGGFLESDYVLTCDEWDLWLRIAGEYPLGVVNEDLVYYRAHSESLFVNTEMKKKVRNWEFVVQRAVNRNPGRLRPLMSKALSRLYYGAAVNFIRQNQFKEARKYFWYIVRHFPVRFDCWIYLMTSFFPPVLVQPLINLKRHLAKRATIQNY